MRSSLLAACTLAIGVTACDKPAPAPPKKEIQVRSAEQKKLFELDEMNRAIGLKRAIYASGSTCPRADATRFIGKYKNMDMWAVRCSDKRDWALFIGADNSVQVRLCKDTEAVGLPACKLNEATPVKEQPAPKA
ncbi:MAG TPA: hypothetical protein VHM21_02350 [Sphingomicrobium sp.]|jgi:hypothetical protein|nr:hypothetical protein [Sphingomicrobium sp.]